MSKQCAWCGDQFEAAEQSQVTKCQACLGHRRPGGKAKRADSVRMGMYGGPVAKQVAA